MKLIWGQVILYQKLRRGATRKCSRRRAGALSRRRARGATRQRLGVGPQAHQEKSGPASS